MGKIQNVGEVMGKLWRSDVGEREMSPEVGNSDFWGSWGKIDFDRIFQKKKKNGEKGRGTGTGSSPIRVGNGRKMSVMRPQKELHTPFFTSHVI